jgi:CheY-like chemotaxis protein
VVLLVDDDHDFRELIAEVLAANGFEVVKAASGEVAIECTKKWRPQIVITDLNMPGISGVELCEYYLHKYSPPAPAVVVISGFAMAESELRRRGAAAFLAKPFDPEDLVDVVRAVVGGVSPDLEKLPPLNATRRATARAVAAAAFAAGLATNPEIDKHARRVAAWLGGYFRPAIAALLFPDQSGLSIILSNAPDKMASDKAPSEIITVAENVLETGGAIIVPDLRAQPWLGIDSSKLRFVAAVPFWYRHLPVGVIVLASATALRMEASDMAILEHLASKASSRIDGTTRLIGNSGLLSRQSFNWILENEASAANNHGETVALMLLRMSAPLDATFGPLLEKLPAARVEIGEIRSEVVGLALRAPREIARDMLHASSALVRAHADVSASAELVVASPAPGCTGQMLLEWAELLLNETIGAPPGAHVTVLAQPVWDGHSRS